MSTNTIFDRLVNVLKNNLLLNLLLLIYVCFHLFFEKFFNNYLINPFFSTFEDSWLTVVLFLIGVLFSIYGFIKNIRSGKFISDSHAYFATIITLFWVYYRHVHTIWEFVEVGNISFIKYIDLALISSFFILISKLVYKGRTLLVDQKLGLMTDNAIEDEFQDKLGRVDIASDLAIKIINTKTKKGSIAIGIVAPWGYGKTSFLNLLEIQLLKNEAEIIKFNPWCYEKEKSLTTAFFNEISSVLKKHNPELSSEIKYYAQILSSVDYTATKVLSKVIENKQEKDFNSTFKLIDETIQKIGKQIIIYIDDLDRLDKNEISEILKLIRNSANFTNMIFVGAYDRNYLINALQKINSYQSPIYLEKIFQFEFTLPDYDSRVLNEQIFELTKEFVREDDIEKLKKALFESRYWKVYTGFVDEHINSMRDVKRFVNTFRVAYERLKGDVEIVDLMNVELLRLKFPNIYDLMVSKWESFLTIKDNYTRDQLVLWSPSMSKSNDYLYANSVNIEFKGYIASNLTELGLRKNRIEGLMLIIYSLFPEYGSLHGNLKKINNANAIRRYFYYTLLDSDLSEFDFNKLWKLPYEEIISQINDMIINKSRSLVTQIANRIPNGTDEYIKMINAIFYIGSKSKGWINDFSEVSRFLNMNTFFESNENYKLFITDLLNKNWDNEYVKKYLYSLYERLNWNFILTKEEVIELNLNFFQKLIVAEESVKTCLYNLFYTTHIDWISAGGGGYKETKVRNKTADQLFINYVTNKPTELFILVIRKHMGDDSLLYIDNYIETIWETWKNFEDFVYNLENKTAATLEFVEFMEQCKEHNYTQGIPFEFNEIDFSK